MHPSPVSPHSSTSRATEESGSESKSPPRDPAQDGRRSGATAHSADLLGTSAAPAVESAEGASRRALRTLSSLAVVAALYWARDILVLVCLAAFVAFVMAPVARGLERIRVPKGLAAALSVLALAGFVLGVMWVSASQAVDLARRLPEYRKTLETKFAGLKSGGVASPIVEASRNLAELEVGLAPQVKVGAKAPVETVAVHVVNDDPTSLGFVGGLAGSVLGPLGNSAVVVLLAIFLLLYQMDVRERILGIGSLHRIGVTSQALEEAGKLVARYLLSNLIINVAYGAAVGVGIHLIGVPNAWLWGLLCALLRFIPYIGTWMGAVLPLAVSVAVFDGWGKTGAVFATILGIDVVVGNVVEPIVYGHRTGLSPLAVVLATIFWTWLWGIPGILLAVPMTLCLAVIGRFIPGFGLFHVLLGDQPALAPAERAYERLVALDTHGASRAVTEAAERLGVAEAHDEILLGALRRADRDRREGILDEARYLTFCDGVREVVDAGDVSPVTSPPTVLCLPAFAESDRVACEMLARLLRPLDVSIEVGPNATSLSDGVPAVGGARVATVGIVALPPFAGLRARYGLRRARNHHVRARFVCIVLDPEADRAKVSATLLRAGAAEVVFSLAEAVRTLTPSTVVAPGESGESPSDASPSVAAAGVSASLPA